jgi:VCBS repeat-containing protein
VGSVSGTLSITDVDSAETFVAETISGTYGSLEINANGAWTYTLDDTAAATEALNDGDTPTDTLTVTTADGTTASIEITVNGTNDAAEFTTGTIGGVQEDDTLTATGTLTISDVDNPDAFDPISNQSGTYGTFSLQANGAWTYTLDNAAVQSFAEGEMQNDSFTVTAVDGTTGTVTVEVTGTDDVAQITGNLIGTIDEIGAINVGGPDEISGALIVTDVDSADQVFVATTSTGTYGSFDISTSGSWTYTLDNSDPDTDALTDVDSVTDVFTVQTADGTTEDVTITVEGTNDAPQGPLTGTIADSNEDADYTIQRLALVGDFVDAENDPVRIQSIAVSSLTAAAGTIVDNGNNTYTFDPTADFNGEVTLDLTVWDGTAVNPDLVTRTFNVLPVNDAPTGTPGGSLPATNEDTAVTFSTTILTTGFTDVDGDELSVTALSASNGDIVDNGNGTITYTPGLNFNSDVGGDVVVTYTVTDGNGGNVQNQTVSLTVNSVNDAPTGIPTGTIPNTSEDTPLTINLTTLLAGFSDVDGDTLAVQDLFVSIGDINGTGPFTYTPPTDYNGLVTLSYDVIDNNGGEIRNVERTFTVTPENDIPVGSPTGTIPNGTEDETLRIELATLVQGYTDEDGDELSAIGLTITEGEGAISGIVDEATGDIIAYTFTPDANFNGPVTIQYSVFDGTAVATPDASLSFNIAAVNDAPTADGTLPDVIATIDENTSATIAIADILDNFSDIDGDQLSLVNPEASTGALSIDGDNLLYVPAAGFDGEVTITYDVSDNNGGLLQSVTQILTVNATNDDPTGAINISGTFDEDTPLTANLSQLADQDGIPDDLSAFSFQWQTSTDNDPAGTWTDIGSPIVGDNTFTPTNDEVGLFLRAVVTYTDLKDFDNTVTSNPTAIAINNVNDAPSVNPEESRATLANIDEDTSATILVSDLLQGFEDVDANDTLTVTSVTVNAGLITPNGDNFTYTPDDDFFGSVTVTYTVEDSAGAALPGQTLSFTVNSVNDAPEISGPIERLINERDATLTIDLLEGASDVEDATLAIANVTPETLPDGVTLNGTTLTVDPSAYGTLSTNERQTLTFNYNINDDELATVSQTATITIEGANDPPTGSPTGDLPNGREDEPVDIDVATLLAGFDDTDGRETLSVTNITVTNGAITTEGDSFVAGDTLTFAPELDYFGPVTLTYTVQDSEGEQLSGQTLSFNLTGLNDGPVVTGPVEQVISEDDGITSVNLLEGASDVDDERLFIGDFPSELPAGFSLEGTTLTVDPTVYNSLAADATTAFTFNYEVQDLIGVAVDQSATVTITGVNDAPIGSPTALLPSSNQDTPRVFAQSALLEGFSDPDNDSLSVLNPSVNTGSVEIDSETGDILFSPGRNYFGEAVLTYEVTDGTTTIDATQTFDVLRAANIFNFQQLVEFNEVVKGVGYTGPSLDTEFGGVNLAALYDETYYLNQNRDVAEAIRDGFLQNGFQHFVSSGLFEGRDPSLYFNSDLYLENRPDVAAAIEREELNSALEHYLLAGQREANQVVSDIFDAEDYLAANPDVAAVVEGGGLTAFEHFVESGASEGRLNVLLFEEAFYRSQNADVANAVAFGDGYNHYLQFGRLEAANGADSRGQTGAFFSEVTYLGANPDVAAAVDPINGPLVSGFEHYFRFGRSEERALFPTVENG